MSRDIRAPYANVPGAKVAFAVPPSSRELPTVPSFHAEPALDLRKQFIAALKELTGVVVTEPPPDFDKFLRERFPNAKTICSGVPEDAGKQQAGRHRSLVRRQQYGRYGCTFSARRRRAACRLFMSGNHHHEAPHQPHGMLSICAPDRSQAVLRRDSLRLRRDSAALIASALRCKPCCSAADISGSSTRCTPSRPMTLGKESVTPNVRL
jgi:hypothetical protein